MASIQKLVIFDFDGVLVDTLDMALAINQEIRPAITREEYLHNPDNGIYAGGERRGKKKAAGLMGLS